jgi:hypothetical protein
VALEAGVAERTRAFMQRRIAGTQAESEQWRQTAEAKAAEQNAELQALARARQANSKSLDALRDRWRLEQADRAARDEADRLAKLALQREAEAESRRERAARTIQIWCGERNPIGVSNARKPVLLTICFLPLCALFLSRRYRVWRQRRNDRKAASTAPKKKAKKKAAGGAKSKKK